MDKAHEDKAQHIIIVETDLFHENINHWHFIYSKKINSENLFNQIKMEQNESRNVDQTMWRKIHGSITAGPQHDLNHRHFIVTFTLPVLLTVRENLH